MLLQKPEAGKLEMIDTNLAFECFDVEATLITSIVSIKNPLSDYIMYQKWERLFIDIPDVKGKGIMKKQCCCA